MRGDIVQNAGMITRAARSAISATLTSPISGSPKPATEAPAPVKYTAGKPARRARWALNPSNTPGARTTSSEIQQSAQPRDGLAHHLLLL